MKGRGPAISVPAFHRLRWRRDNRASVSVAATASWPIDTSSARLSTNINSAARNGRTGSGQVRRPAAWESISITRRERERERERSDLMAEGRRLLSPAAIYRCSHRRQAQREAPSVRPTDADGRRSLAGRLLDVLRRTRCLTVLRQQPECNFLARTEYSTTNRLSEKLVDCRCISAYICTSHKRCNELQSTFQLHFFRLH